MKWTFSATRRLGWASLTTLGVCSCSASREVHEASTPRAVLTAPTSSAPQTAATVEVAPRKLRALSLSCSGSRCCAILDDETVRCWGFRWRPGEGIASDPPFIVKNLPPVAEVAVGGGTICARTSSGQVYCSGIADRVGDGSLVERPSPVPLKDLDDAVQLTVGGTHSCAVHRDGKLSCWGDNFLGQGLCGVGVGAPGILLQPRWCSSVGTISMATAGWQHTCLLLQAGTLGCWGDNRSGQLGNGRLRDRDAVPKLPGMKNVIQARAGDNHTCVLTGAREVLCWGANKACQAGERVANARPRPGPITGLSAIREIALGASHSCALAEGGDVFCWGDALHQHDSATPDPQNCRPRKMATGAEHIAAGDGFSCILQHDGEVACWGSNASGQLGDGTLIDHENPERVRW